MVQLKIKKSEKTPDIKAKNLIWDKWNRKHIKTQPQSKTSGTSIL